MQPLIRFYVLPQTENSARLDLVCRLVEKAQTENQRVYILCTDENMAAALDELLWTYKPSAFIPHCREGEQQEKHANILIGIPPSRARKTDVLINLSLLDKIDIPAGCSRVFEIVSQSEDVLKITRTRFQQYRQRGLQPESIRL